MLLELLNGAAWENLWITNMEIETREKKAYLKRMAKKMAMCETISYIYLYCGSNFTEQNIIRFWNYPGIFPSYRNISANVTVANIRWFIHEKIKIDDVIWNGSFLSGMTISGKIGVSKKRMPFFNWAYNNEIKEMIKECPFHGKIEYDRENYHRWSEVAALCLKNDKNSISYLAGVLSIGKKYIIDNATYSGYSKKIKNLLVSLNIPIEKETHYLVFISPIWLALLTPWMPESRKKWLDVKKPCMAEEYAFVLWRVYTGKDIEANKIPFLPSRRTYYYRYHTIDNLEKKWVDFKLVELDVRFKEVIQKWANNELPNNV
jgi:hypothetical protein